MSLSILQSIHPKYCELIASGKKTIEVRKTKPRIPTPFKTYIYQSKHKWVYRILEKLGLYQGKIIGEYVCDEIQEITMNDYDYGYYDISDDDLRQTCLSHAELWKYGKGKTIYLWHISNLKIYDQPKELSEFFKACDKPKGTDCSVCIDNREQSCKSLTRAPQSWCYVETV